MTIEISGIFEMQAIKLAFFRRKRVIEAAAIEPKIDFESIIGRIANQASGFGKESAELHGVIADVTSFSHEQIKTFAALCDKIDTLLEANQVISDATNASKASVLRARATVEKFARGVSGVGNSLNQIAVVAGDITRIAVHTRIVSLTAAVEAQRAGKAGTGFSTVAEAVKELAGRVEQSSTLIASTIEQLEARIARLTQDIRSAEANQKSGVQRESFHVALSKVDHGVDNIAAAAQKNLHGCKELMHSMRGLTEQVNGTALVLQNAGKETDTFLSLSEELIELIAESGIRTDDSPFIEAILVLAGQIGQLFDDGIEQGAISIEDAFDAQYRAIQNTSPEQFVTRYTQFADRMLPAMLESAMGWSPKIAFCVATDQCGYVPNNVKKYAKTPGPDPIWNQANCRYRRVYDGRTEMAAIRSKQKFLLQTYRRDMGSGNFVVMKHLSAPIFVGGKKWGALRVGYEF